MSASAPSGLPLPVKTRTSPSPVRQGDARQGILPTHLSAANAQELGGEGVSLYNTLYGYSFMLHARITQVDLDTSVFQCCFDSETNNGYHFTSGSGFPDAVYRYRDGDLQALRRVRDALDEVGRSIPPKKKPADWVTQQIINHTFITARFGNYPFEMRPDRDAGARCRDGWGFEVARLKTRGGSNTREARIKTAIRNALYPRERSPNRYIEPQRAPPPMPANVKRENRSQSPRAKVKREENPERKLSTVPAFRPLAPSVGPQTPGRGRQGPRGQSPFTRGQGQNPSMSASGGAGRLGDLGVNRKRSRSRSGDNIKREPQSYP